MDAFLWFEVLFYLNVYYYPMFAITNLGMWAAKYNSVLYVTPTIGYDAIAQVIVTSSELIKLILFKKLKYHYKELSIIVGVILTAVSTLSVLYVFIIQSPVLKMEYGLDIIMFALLVTELFFGIISFIPRFGQKQTEN